MTRNSGVSIPRPLWWLPTIRHTCSARSPLPFRGRQKGIAEVYRSHKEAGSLLRKTKLEIAVNEAYVQPTIDAIIAGARTGQIGDGKILILDLSECVRIRTGETGGAAIG